MADNKKYYYMRLKENFFDTDEMVYLEGLEEGYLFSNILLKLYLRSLKNDGVLMMNSLVPYDARMISRFTNHSLSTVEKALFEFNKLGLIEMLDSGQMYMSNIELFVGKTTTEADRKRLGRMKVEQKLIENKEDGQMSDKCPPEKELELELKLEKELEGNIVPAKAETVVQANKMPDEMIEMILNYFNQKLNKTRGFSKTDSTTKLLNALYKAGYKDIGLYQYVIDNKYNEWINNEKYKKYLQPATLFAKENFEKYMEQDEISLTPATNNNNQRSIWEVEAYGSQTSESIDGYGRNDVQKLLQY